MDWFICNKKPIYLDSFLIFLSLIFQRKPEEDEADESSKKPRQENGAGDAPATNGNGTVANGNGTAENGNGHAESPEKKVFIHLNCVMLWYN